jgi:PAS domain-containing protein
MVEKKVDTRLASFPEQNPNPVIELDLISGIVTYLNPAAKKHFPGLLQQNIDHPIFEIVRANINNKDPEFFNELNCEVSFDTYMFELKLYRTKNTDILRVYASDISERKRTEKKLQRLALFPEQNPNPVIELDLETKMVTYSNPAAKKKFPDFPFKNSDHPLFNSIKLHLAKRKDFQCEVIIDEHIFEQKIYFIEKSEMIRVYSTDITEQKKTEKNLSRLASFPELNPSPIIEINLEGNITYLNPASRNNFPDLNENSSYHPVLDPFKKHFERLKNGEIDNYSVEIKIDNKYFIQRGRLLLENGVIRIFNIDITQQKQTEELIKEKNKDITDSINYAKKIQQSILPSEELLSAKRYN